MYKIKKNVPIPEKRLHNSFPWRLMEIGDSFDVPIADLKHGSNTVYSSYNAWRKRHKPIKITIRAIKEENLIRVWRIE